MDAVSRPRLPARPDLRVRGVPGAPLAPRRGAHPVVERGVRLRHAWTTSSRPARSIMPQKKNPDFAELVRGKTGRVLGDLQSLLVTLKGLPLAYNKDMQEDKEPAFDAIDTLADSLRAMSGMLDTMRVNAERDARRRARRLHGRDRPRRLPGGQGRALPRGARGRRPARARVRARGPHAAGPDRRGVRRARRASSAPTCSTPSTSTRWSRAASPPAEPATSASRAQLAAGQRRAGGRRGWLESVSTECARARAALP